MFKLSQQPLEKIELRKDFESSSAGAFCSFEGLVRDDCRDGKKVVALEYEADDTLCAKEYKKIFDEVRAAYTDVIDIRCYHRVGHLKVGEMAVWVGVLAGHRDQAFRANRYIIDELKNRLPIWKKEYFENGESSFR